MLPDTEYKQAANNAEHHIQLTIDSINIAADAADVTGSVCRVFRGSNHLLGTTLTLQVSCISDNGDNDWPPDGMGRIPTNLLQTGRVLEAYLEQTSLGLAICLDLYMIIDSLTQQPQLRFDQENKIQNEKLESNAIAQNKPSSTYLPLIVLTSTIVMALVLIFWIFL